MQESNETEEPQSPYLFHIPHAGLEIPQAFLGDYLLSHERLRDEILEYADLYTDRLFEAAVRRHGAVRFPWSRLFVDVERFFDDKAEAMYRKHRMGWFYEYAATEKLPLRTLQRKNEAVEYYREHHERLSRECAARLEAFGRCVIVDCHSFSDDRGYWFFPRNEAFPDLCIGYDDYHADRELIARIEEAFEDREIAHNRPYAGALVPLEYYGKDPRVRSVMIEINKRLYLEADNRTPSSAFDVIRRRLESLFLD